MLFFAIRVNREFRHTTWDNPFLTRGRVAGGWRPAGWSSKQRDFICKCSLKPKKKHSWTLIFLRIVSYAIWIFTRIEKIFLGRVVFLPWQFCIYLRFESIWVQNTKWPQRCVVGECGTASRSERKRYDNSWIVFYIIT